MDDAELVERARRGDRRALAALVERHRPAALAVCTALLRRPEVAEDVVQEALLVAVVDLDRLRRPERFRAWLCGIALNVARRWLREAGRRSTDATPATVTDPHSDPAETVVASETAARVRRAVAELPSGQGQAITLFYLAERSGSEVADTLSISEAAAKTRLHKGRQSLRRALADEREAVTVTTIEMHVAAVLREPAGAEPVRRHAIVLEDETGGHRLRIYVGEPEATALALRLAETDLPRPMTHALLTNVINALGGRVVGVHITRLAERTFFGEIELDGPGGNVTVDARPSDAVNLAILAEAPIRVEPAVLTEVDATGTGDPDAALTEGVEQIVADFQAALAEVHRLVQAAPDPPDAP